MNSCASSGVISRREASPHAFTAMPKLIAFARLRVAGSTWSSGRPNTLAEVAVWMSVPTRTPTGALVPRQVREDQARSASSPPRAAPDPSTPGRTRGGSAGRARPGSGCSAGWGSSRTGARWPPRLVERGVDRPSRGSTCLGGASRYVEFSLSSSRQDGIASTIGWASRASRGRWRRWTAGPSACACPVIGRLP